MAIILETSPSPGEPEGPCQPHAHGYRGLAPLVLVLKLQPWSSESHSEPRARPGPGPPASSTWIRGWAFLVSARRVAAVTAGPRVPWTKTSVAVPQCGSGVAAWMGESATVMGRGRAVGPMPASARRPGPTGRSGSWPGVLEAAYGSTSSLWFFFCPRRAENRTFRPPVTQKQKTF